MKRICQMPKENNNFYFGNEVNCKCHKTLDKSVFKELWASFCAGMSKIETKCVEEYEFKLGNAESSDVESYTFVINATVDGVTVSAKDAKSLIDGYYALLGLVEVDGDGKFHIPCGVIKEKETIKNRMIHFCVFPETELYEIERFIKLCGALRYTHIIIEFWGSVKLDCMKELAWENAYTKDEIKPLIDIANDLGIEIIPMFNHWGHASGSRVLGGKHVVLDQNPALLTYFDRYGWSWDIRKKEVRSLQSEIRKELIDLCGEGSYFHIGCDEAYGYEDDFEMCEVVSEYVNEISEEMKRLGRRIIMWGDMLLLNDRHNKGQDFSSSNKEFHVCSCVDEKTEQMFLKNISRDIIIGDWQYWRRIYPINTSLFFKEQGFDVIPCSWNVGEENIVVSCDTVKNHNLFGYMHTTWHTLENEMHVVVAAGISGYKKEYNLAQYKNVIKPITASLIRKVSPSNGDYKKSGWVKKQVK